MGIGLILLLGFTCYASRGLYWACRRSGTPSYIMGTTVGICSVIGFLPDVFVYPIIGYWQDTLPAAEAYRNMWLMGMAALAMVIVFTFCCSKKFVLLIAPLLWLAASKSRKLQEKNHVEKIHHRD